MTNPTPSPAIRLTREEVAQLAIPPGPAPSVYAVRGRWQIPAGLYAYPVTQDAFAALLGVPAATIRDWEQGRRKPDAAAARLLALFDAAPQEMRAALARLAGRPLESAAVP